MLWRMKVNKVMSLFNKLRNHLEKPVTRMAGLAEEDREGEYRLSGKDER